MDEGAGCRTSVYSRSCRRHTLGDRSDRDGREPPLEAAPPEHEGRSVADAGEIGAPGEPEVDATAAFGTLRVYVRSRDTGEALARVRLFLAPAGEDSWMYEPVDSARGRPGVGPLSGADGLVEFEMPLEQAYVLKAQRGIFVDEAEDVSVLPFALSETREIVLELRTVYDRPFLGRVVTFGREEPIHGASISIAEGFLKAHTDADGYFETRVPSSYRLHAEAKAPGYAAAIFDVSGEHESREDARVVRLQGAARLDVLVLARDGAPLEGVRVRGSTDVHHVAQCTLGYGCLHGGPFRWSSRTGAAGRCSLTDGPSGRPRVLRSG